MRRIVRDARVCPHSMLGIFARFVRFRGSRIVLQNSTEAFFRSRLSFVADHCHVPLFRARSASPRRR